MQIIKESAPHLRRKDNMATMMLDVIIALLPTVIFSLVIFKLDALRNILLSIATMELCEFVFVLIKNRIPYDGNKHTLKEHFEKQRKAYTINNFLVPLVSALIFAMIMPASSNLLLDLSSENWFSAEQERTSSIRLQSVWSSQSSVSEAIILILTILTMHILQMRQPVRSQPVLRR